MGNTELLRSDVQHLELSSATVQALQDAIQMARRSQLSKSKWAYRLPWIQKASQTILFSDGTEDVKVEVAGIVARYAHVGLMRIDLSSVVGKYIGETEKNLDRLFPAAETRDDILFFDEADALFGRRSETNDSRDRYANLDTDYLLERIERYPGVVVLTTNFPQCLDERLMRRIRMVVELPSSG